MAIFHLILWRKRGESYEHNGERTIDASSGEAAAYVWAAMLGILPYQWRDMGNTPRPEYIFRVEN